jgi:hypothetical protein
MVFIAYCLYGQPRNLTEGSNNIKKFVKNHNVDFYYHTWTLPNENAHYSHSEYRNVPKEELKGDKDIITKINSIYNPKAYLFEESKHFDIEKNNEYINSIAYLNTPEFNKGIRISHTLSQLYSKQQVRNLLYNTIEKENIKYDFVITSRFDFLKEINLTIDLNNRDNQKIYVSNILKPRDIFSDNILLLGVENYFKLLNIYDNLSNLINNKTLENTLITKYNEKLVLVPESLVFANYLYYFNDIKRLEYVNFPFFV